MITSIGRWKIYLAAIFGVWAVSIGLPARCDDGNLVANGDFANRDSRGMPVSWSPWLPEVREAACRLRAGAEGLLIDAPGRPYGVGGMRQDIRRVQVGRTYAVEVTCKTEGVPSPYRSLLVRLTWTRAGQPLQPAVQRRTTSCWPILLWRAGSRLFFDQTDRRTATRQAAACATKDNPPRVAVLIHPCITRIFITRCASRGLRIRIILLNPIFGTIFAPFPTQLT